MQPSKIYVASSWRNEFQPSVVETLRYMGHEVYDFRNPPNGNKGFAWSDIDPAWEQWTSEQYRNSLSHPIAFKGFHNDFDGMNWADTCVLVLPCGRSAHTEAGYLMGKGKHVVVYQPVNQEPELMYYLDDTILISDQELRRHFFCTE